MRRTPDELSFGAGIDDDSPSEQTQRVAVPSFDEKTSGGWKPFRFQKLERINKTQMLLAERMAQLIPGVATDGVVPGELLTRLRELLDADFSLRADYVHVVRPDQLRKYLATPTFLSVVAPLPHKPRGLLEVELGLAHKAIDLLLGGPGEMLGLRPLTEIEEGVMSFLVLETLKALAPHLDPGLPKLRLEGIVRKLDVALAPLNEEPHVAVAQIKATLAGHTGYIRLFIPESVLRMSQGLAPGSERAARQARRVRPHLGRLAGAKTWLRVEIGRTEITSDALRALTPKDVLVVEELTALPHRGEGGTAQLRIGLGRAGRMDAEVSIEEGKLFAKITAFALGDTPMQGEHGEESDETPERSEPGAKNVDDSNEGAELLSDIPLQIAVELARVAVTAEEVVTLKVGQVFDLQRVPGEPVDLSVSGKVVARGELVEVDGHLGVRILSLLG